MRISLKNIFIVLFLWCGTRVSAQPDTDPPVPPVFYLLTVQPSTGYTALSWSGSSSHDVAGYVVYNYRNGEAFAFDTIHNPLARSYINTGSLSSSLIESYVVAAIDSSGNISPLSNVLNTIFVNAVTDTCQKTLNISWNKYLSSPKTVSGYTILISENNGPFTVAGQTSADINSFNINNFRADLNYCFEIKADIETGLVSYSNRQCLLTKMQRAPEWINADYATVNQDGKISLSFSYDPLSEIKKFSLERKRSSESVFTRISLIDSDNGKITYTDLQANPSEMNEYRLAAVNNCGNTVVFSNSACNIVTGLIRTDNVLYLKWNSYRSWLGGITDYKVFLNTGTGYNLKASLQESDTVYAINYSDIMYDISGNDICFYVVASENLNIHNISGESVSTPVCTVITEKVTVPNAFTPDGDNLNDLFRPVLSFTPAEYRLIITDRQNNTLFESTDHHAGWDGTRSGNQIPPGVYLWYLKTKPPSGKIISKSGTITILKTR